MPSEALVWLEVPKGWVDHECLKCDEDPNEGLAGVYPLEYGMHWHTWGWYENEWCFGGEPPTTTSTTEGSTTTTPESYRFADRSYGVAPWCSPTGRCYVTGYVTVTYWSTESGGILICKQQWRFGGAMNPGDTKIVLRFQDYRTWTSGWPYNCDEAACAEDHPDTVTVYIGEPPTTTSSTTTTPP